MVLYSHVTPLLHQRRLGKGFGVVPEPRTRMHCAGLCGPDVVSRMRREAELDEHDGCVNSVQYSTDGALLCTGSDDCEVKIWSADTHELITSVRTGHGRNIFCAKFLPETNNSELVSGALDGQLRHMYVNRRDADPKVLDDVDRYVAKVAFCQLFPRCAVYACGNGTARMCDLRAPNAKPITLATLTDPNSSSTRRNIFSSNDQQCSCVSFSPLHPYCFALAGGDIYVRLYDIRYCVEQSDESSMDPYMVRLTSQRLKERYDTYRRCQGISGVEFNSKGTEVVATFKGDCVYVLPVSPTSTQTAWSLNLDRVLPCSAFPGRPRGQQDENGDAGSGTNLIPDAQAPAFEGRRNVQTMLKEATFFHNDKYIITGGDCGNIYIWETESQKLVKLLKGDCHIVNGIVAHPFRPEFASCGIDNSAKIWAPTGEPSGIDDDRLATSKEANDRLELESDDDDDDETSVDGRRLMTTLLELLRSGRTPPGELGRLMMRFRAANDDTDSDEDAAEGPSSAAILMDTDSDDPDVDDGSDDSDSSDEHPSADSDNEAQVHPTGSGSEGQE